MLAATRKRFFQHAQKCERRPRIAQTILSIGKCAQKLIEMNGRTVHCINSVIHPPEALRKRVIRRVALDKQTIGSLRANPDGPVAYPRRATVFARVSLGTRAFSLRALIGCFQRSRRSAVMLVLSSLH
jgi:hypothetical protein